MLKQLSQLDFFYRKAIVFLGVGILASALYGVIDAILIRSIKHLLDLGFVDQDSDFLQSLPFYLIGFFVVRSICGFFSQSSIAQAGIYSCSRLRKRLIHRLLHYPCSVYDQYSSGELLNRILYSTQMCSQLTCEFFIIFVREGVTILGLLVVMFLASPTFTLVYLLSLPLSLYVLNIVGKKSQFNNQEVHRHQEKLSTFCQQLISSQKMVKSFTAQDFERERFSHLLENQRQHELKQTSILAFGSAGVQLIGGLAMTLIIYLSLSPHMPTLSAGEFTSLITAILALLRPVKQMTRLHADIQKIKNYCTNILQMFSWPQEEQGLEQTDLSLNGNIVFKQISFCYPKQEQLSVLKKINLQIQSGTTVAFVGPSGGGKSTLASLVSRFYEPWEGEITLDGVDIKEIPLLTLRQQISVVSQDISLIEGSILSNITYGHKYPNLIKAQVAAELAYADEFIEKLPLQYHSEVGSNGSLLSGGQRQRLALARAFYKKAPILILDEATSSLDHHSEERVQYALQSLMKSSTTLVIAHRLRTIIHADLIVVIDGGTIKEMGKHNELMANQGIYYQMYQGGLEQAL